MFCRRIIPINQTIMLDKLRSLKPDAIVSLDTALLLLRVGAGILIFTHGYGKLSGVLEGNMGFMDPLGLGAGLSKVLVAFAEGICSLLIVVGLWTRLAAIPLVINTTVITFIVHWEDGWGRMELPLFFLIVFLFLLFTGGGSYSLDGLMSRNKR